MPISTSTTADASSTGAPIATPGRTGLRRLLALDAATCVLMGVVLMTAAGPVAAATRLPQALLFHAGAVLMPIAAFMALLAVRTRISATCTLLVVAGNGLWVAASIGIVAAGLVAPNALGLALLAGQALAVAVLAWLEFHALRRARPLTR